MSSDKSKLVLNEMPVAVEDEPNAKRTPTEEEVKKNLVSCFPKSTSFSLYKPDFTCTHKFGNCTKAEKNNPSRLSYNCDNPFQPNSLRVKSLCCIAQLYIYIYIYYITCKICTYSISSIFLERKSLLRG